LLPLTPFAAAGGEMAAVSSRASEDYVRTRLPDGSFQPETYAFGKGGFWSGASRDPTIDNMDFMDVARTIAVPLERQGYIPSKDPKKTRFLIMVYWGTTQPPERENQTISFQNVSQASAALQRAKDSRDPVAIAAAEAAYTDVFPSLQVENARHNRINMQNAQTLGYDSWIGLNAPFAGSPLENRWKDMIDELEESRYFVVLMAYDFQMMCQQKKTKLVWETRFSIGQHRNQFDKQLAAMAQDASKYFGKDSKGLIRERLPDTTVNIGEAKVLEYEPEKKK
jgi:hypothetical protein